MKVLVIGAGAIGQVFARHFQLGGADVSFLVRPKYADATRAGLVVYPLNRGASERGTPTRLVCGVETDQDEALAKGWDLVVLAISSVALRSGDWLERLGRDLGTARLLALQAGPEDGELIHKHIDPSRVAWGMLAVISYQAPLTGESLPEEGVAYWFPMLSSLGFSGPQPVLDEVTTALSKGGMPVKQVADVSVDVQFAGAILEKVVTTLECAGWSFAALRRDPELLDLAVAAMHEKWLLAQARTGVRAPLGMRMIRPFMLRFVLWLAPRILPFDLEAFFAYHYVKVGEQTLMLLDTQLRLYEQHNIPCPASMDIARRLRAGRA